jgi:hypothetical protein
VDGAVDPDAGVAVEDAGCGLSEVSCGNFLSERSIAPGDAQRNRRIVRRSQANDRQPPDPRLRSALGRLATGDHDLFERSAMLREASRRKPEVSEESSCRAGLGNAIARHRMLSRFVQKSRGLIGGSGSARGGDSHAEGSIRGLRESPIGNVTGNLGEDSVRNLEEGSFPARHNIGDVVLSESSALARERSRRVRI